MKTLEHAALLEEFEARTTGAVLDHRSITVNPTSAGVAVALTYKVAAEVGSLGDNGAYLRRQIRDDAIFQHLVRLPLLHHTVVAHTRWASVGEISVPNCHPVDGDRSETSAIIHVCLNGDIDNYQALKQEYEQETGRAVPEAITTDTKIIPLRMQLYLQWGKSVDEAFRLAVNDFEGAHAIAMHTDLAPGRVFLAQKGSGQALFIGLAPDHYVVGSEIYGFVAAASRYLKMDGTTQGQIIVLQQASEGDLSGVQAMTYDGTPMVLSPDDVKETELTSRDIDRQSYPHYFLKEIGEAPRSVEQTMQGRLAVVEQAGRLHPRIELDETVIPPRLAQAFRDQKIRHLFFIGQGTAGVAGDVCAALVRAYLHPTPIQVASCKASEFSGFRLDDQGDATLVVAITQSGTTTDTNRAIDLARHHQAHTLAIAN
jgi:glucosamine--fructose-6-phosphate aminotransferase (isomerizing)